jgi:hypothetical protein
VFSKAALVSPCYSPVFPWKPSVGFTQCLKVSVLLADAAAEALVAPDVVMHSSVNSGLY